MDKENNKASDKDKALITKAKGCLESFNNREDDNIRRAKEAIEFRAGKQWPDAVKNDRENESQEGGPRPCPVLDKTNQYVRQVVNEERQNRAAIRIRPVDDYADPKVAEIYTGIIRHIEDASEAIEAYSTAGEHAIDGGFGYFRILTDYCDPMSFDQDIRIKRIHNRFSVALGYHTEVDGSDCKEALIWEDMRREDFKAEYPNAKEVEFEANDDWVDKDTIRIAEYYRIEPQKMTIHQMDDGTILTDEEYKDLIKDIEEYNNTITELPELDMGEMMELPQAVEIPEPAKSRETVKNQVKWYKITSEEILEQRDIPGTYIPVIKVTGNEITLPDGKIRVSGMIDQMMDPQRLHNYAHAGFIENIALAPRAPWVAADDQIEDYEQDYADANRRNISVLKYKAVSEDGRPLPPPQRTPPPGISSGWQQMLMNTEQGVAGAVGMFGPSVGDFSQSMANSPVSGIALSEQKTQGMIGNFHFPDNLARSIQHCGRILLEWIPVYYDTERVIRIIGEDGEQEMARINPEQEESVMKEKDEFEREVGQIYNLNIGKYDVTVSTGPSYTAKRQEAFDHLVQIVQARPELMNVMGDLVFKSMDSPIADQMSDRMKALLPQEIKTMEDDDIDPQVQAMLQQIEQATQQIEERAALLAQEEQRIANESAQTDADRSKIDAMRKEHTADRKVFMAEVKAEMADIQLMGEKLTNDINQATDSLVNELKNIETQGLGEAEAEDMEATRQMAMQAAIENLAQYQANSAQMITDGINASMERIAGLVTQPRVTELQFDEQGNPIGSISRGG